MKPKKDITIYDIALRLDLSSATVSRALHDNPAINKNTRKKIQETAKQLGYRHNTFASSLRKQKTNTLGVIVHELNSNFITSVLAGIEKESTEAGYDLVIAHSSERYEKEAANALNLFHKRVDGLIASFSAAVCMQTLKEHGVKIPEDIAVVGFNNDAISKIVKPQLTTIHYPGIDMGEITARNLINHLGGISNISHTKTIVVSSELIIRKSSLKKQTHI